MWPMTSTLYIGYDCIGKKSFDIWDLLFPVGKEKRLVVK